MHTVDLNNLELMEGWFANDSTVHFRANFALFGGNGADRSSVVSIRLQPGEALGEHQDSPEEILLVIDGVVEMSVGEERARVPRGTLAVVPPMAPHSFRNIGDEPAWVVGFFPSPGVVATFVEAIQPIEQQVMVFGEAAVAVAGAS